LIDRRFVSETGTRPVGGEAVEWPEANRDPVLAESANRKLEVNENHPLLQSEISRRQWRT
jgi:hypothetical protein